MTSSDNHFPRPDLAHAFALALAGEQFMSAGKNGLFLTAPRRTGKTTFLRRDLTPALENGGAVVVYVDLWSARGEDPGTMIADVIADAIGKAQSLAGRVRDSLSAGEIEIGNLLKARTEWVGKKGGTTLPHALEALSSLSGKPVALIVDEAQQALATESGEHAMYALKSARDTMNSTNRVGLRLVMTGSDRDKLSGLVTSGASPFFGAEVTEMPLLGEDYVRFVADMIETRLPDLAPVDVSTLTHALKTFAHRPEPFVSALSRELDPLKGSGPHRFEKRLGNAARVYLGAEHAAMNERFLSLKALDRAVLWRLLERQGRFRPYDSEALAFYRDKLGSLGDEAPKVSTATVQRALGRLRDTSPPMVWQSARGEYALEDTAMHEWHRTLVERGDWPLANKP